MTVIQEVLLELEGDYLGHPYFVTGNALFNAVARRVEGAARRSLRVSHGVFVPGEYGEYPAWHSQSGGVPYMGAGLRPVEAYDDLFLFRDAAQRWLLESRPRDAHNVHEVRSFGGRAAFARSKVFGRPPSSRNSKRTMTWYVHWYLHADDRDGVVPVDAGVLDGLRVGGSRNHGFGVTSLEETRTVALEDLDFSRVREAEAHAIELVSPYVLVSEYPGAADQSVPWWWGSGEGGLRRRSTRLVDDGDVFEVETVDHGQVVPYTGNDPVGTAKNGVCRVGTHSRFGFGEIRVRPVSDDRVRGRASSTVVDPGGGG